MGLESHDYQNQDLPIFAFRTLRQGLGVVLDELAKQSGQAVNLSIPAVICPDVTFFLNVHPAVANIRYLNVDRNLLPIGELAADSEFYYHCNLFGLAPFKPTKALTKTIVDNAHGFYEPESVATATLTSARKFFGVPNGAYVRTSLEIKSRNIALEAEIPSFLLSRLIHGGPEPGYSAFVANEHELSTDTQTGMSLLSHLIMKGTDLEDAAIKRRQNFAVLHEGLGGINEFRSLLNERYLSPDFVPYSYPLLIDNGLELREHLIEKRIYTPMLWGGFDPNLPLSDWENYFTKNTVHLTVDQRYRNEEMVSIVDAIIGFFSQR